MKLKKLLLSFLLLITLSLFTAISFPKVEAVTYDNNILSYPWSIYNTYGDNWAMRVNESLTESYVDMIITIPESTYNAYTDFSYDRSRIVLTTSLTTKTIYFDSMYGSGFMNAIKTGDTITINDYFMNFWNIPFNVEDIINLEILIYQNTIYNGGQGVPSQYYNNYNTYGTINLRKILTYDVIYYFGSEIYDTETNISGLPTAPSPAPTLAGYVFTGWRYTANNVTQFYNFSTTVTSELLNNDGEFILQATFDEETITTTEITTTEIITTAPSTTGDGGIDYSKETDEEGLVYGREYLDNTWSPYNYYDEHWAMKTNITLTSQYDNIYLRIPASSYNTLTYDGIDSDIIITTNEDTYTITLPNLYGAGFIGDIFNGQPGVVTLKALRNFASIPAWETITDIQVRIVQNVIYDGGQGVPSQYVDYFEEYGNFYGIVIGGYNVEYYINGELFEEQFVDSGLPTAPATTPDFNGKYFNGWWLYDSTINAQRIYDFNNFYTSYLDENNILKLYGKYNFIDYDLTDLEERDREAFTKIHNNWEIVEMGTGKLGFYLNVVPQNTFTDFSIRIFNNTLSSQAGIDIKYPATYWTYRDSDEYPNYSTYSRVILNETATSGYEISFVGYATWADDYTGFDASNYVKDDDITFPDYFEIDLGNPFGNLPFVQIETFRYFEMKPLWFVTYAMNEPIHYYENIEIYIMSNFEYKGTEVTNEYYDEIELYYIKLFTGYSELIERYQATYKVSFYDRMEFYESITFSSFEEIEFPDKPIANKGFRFVGWKTPSGYITNGYLDLQKWFDENAELNLYSYYQPYNAIEGEDTDFTTNIPDGLKTLFIAFGLYNTFGLILIVLVLLIAVNIGLAFLKANIVIYFIINTALVVLFTFLGFIPLYLALVIGLGLTLVAIIGFGKRSEAL